MVTLEAGEVSPRIYSLVGDAVYSHQQADAWGPQVEEDFFKLQEILGPDHVAVTIDNGVHSFRFPANGRPSRVVEVRGTEGGSFLDLARQAAALAGPGHEGNVFVFLNR